MKTALIILLLLMATPIVAAGNLAISDQNMVADLVELDEIISSIASGVMGCMDSGKKHKQCMCENRMLFGHFTEAANELFRKYPQLEGQDLVNFKNPEGVLVNFSLETAKRQAEVELLCNE